jgi:hypothetical protein
LTDFSQTALSSTALPLSLNAESFGQRIGSVFDATSGGSFGFSIVWPVPEPDSLILLLGAIIIMVVIARYLGLPISQKSLPRYGQFGAPADFL